MQTEGTKGPGMPMSEKSFSPMIFGIIIIVVIGVFYFLMRDDGGSADVAMMEASKEDAKMEKTEDKMMEGKPEGAMMEKKDTVVALAAQNTSDQAGKATLSDVGGKTKVAIEIASGSAGVAQPAHIHVGACPAPGAVAYPLSSVVNGKSETMLSIAMTDLISKLPLAINVHKSADDAKTYVSCGDIVADAMMEKK